MVPQIWIYQNQWVICFKWESGVSYELYFNKAIVDVKEIIQRGPIVAFTQFLPKVTYYKTMV